MTVPLDPPPRDQLEGIVDHLVFVAHNQHTVLRLSPSTDDHQPPPVTAVGTALFGAQPGESLRLTGTWTHHPRHGRQFKASTCQRTWPATIRAIRLYLASGLIPGIGDTLAEAIVAHFGESTLTVIDTGPQRLREVRGIGPGRLQRITEAWRTQKSLADLMVFLQGLNIPAHLAARIHRTYADTDEDPVDIVRRTPYRLCRDVRGIGFDTADRIALAAGLPKHSDQRLQAALLHVLGHAHTTQGHCHLPEPVLLARTRQLLDDPDPATAELLQDPVLRHGLERLRAEGDIVSEDLPAPGVDDQPPPRPRRTVSLTAMHRAETSLAADIRRLRSASSALAARADWHHALAHTASGELTAEQQHAVLTALTHPVSVLTGGPGCGKTHTLRTLTDLARAAGVPIALAAPTGKAAKRLEETTGCAATTVHRLIRATSGHNSVVSDDGLVVVDEASMLDVPLAARLAGALPAGCHLLLVGDTDQLPSIGPGRVLNDLLAVPAIPRTRLTRIFRQDDGAAAITDNARRILRGLTPLPAAGVFGCLPRTDPDRIAQEVVDLVADHIPRHYAVTPADVQVLCPSRRHTAGALDLNLRLQARLNPPTPGKPQCHHDGRIYRLGDRVLQIRNNPDRGSTGVFNGATGTIAALDTDTHHLTVTFTDGENATYPFTDLDELLHAYALTVHRSQGSEYPYVVIPVTTSASVLLQRNLLYTAVTRARRGVVLIGQPDAVRRAVAATDTRRRFTALSYRLLQPVCPSLRSTQALVGQLALL